MPIYNYKCPECEQVFEKIVKMSDPLPDNCPKCGFEGNGFIKTFSSTGTMAIKKGDGWTHSNNSALTRRRRAK